MALDEEEAAERARCLKEGARPERVREAKARGDTDGEAGSATRMRKDVNFEAKANAKELAREKAKAQAAAHAGRERSMDLGAPSAEEETQAAA